MFDFLERMRKEPLSKRRTIAFVVSLVFTLSIGAVWYIAVFPDVTSTHVTSVDFMTPQETLSTNIATALDGLKESLSSLHQVINVPATSTQATPPVIESQMNVTVSTSTATTTQ